MKVSNEQLLRDLAESHEAGQITPSLAAAFVAIATRYVNKPQFSCHEYRDDMLAEALLQCCKVWRNFDFRKYDNPYAYFTQCVSGACHVVYCRELKQQRLQQ